MEGMPMWTIIISAFLVAFALCVIYLTIAVSRFGMFQKLSRGKGFVKYAISFLIIALVSVGLTAVTSVVNAVIIGLHFAFFFLLFGIVMKIAEKRAKKACRVYWQGWLAITVTILYLIIGAFQCYHIWQKDYSLQTQKNVGQIHFALIADAHLGTTFDGNGFREHLQKIQKQNPEFLLIAGDFVDDSTKRKDFEIACEALAEMNLKYGVWYAFGNHDAGYYGSRDFTANDIREIMGKNGIHVLEDAYELIDDRFYIVGRRDGHDPGRQSIQTLLSGLDQEKYVIVINHEPNDYDNEETSAADLVVSGHTHGGQMFPWTALSKVVKADDLVYGHVSRGNVDFIVTSGISDWEILFKTGTRSEYVMITVEGN
ncbi:MAG: metallophosphoesterase [Lachnospiraceae bacterium]|nr:metallophosphoesterase [Lachnospiraceae bacterium]MBR3507488.1 metallophosphoesterase [Lachnospiraceae bacterium]